LMHCHHNPKLKPFLVLKESICKWKNRSEITTYQPMICLKSSLLSGVMMYRMPSSFLQIHNSTQLFE
jgi:hypothetical protein